MSKRTVEVFSAGCPACDETVKLVESIACPRCDVQVHDMHTEAAQAQAKAYGITRVPSVVVNRKPAVCCETAVDAAALRALGVGSPA